jgi:hypothetical protein
MSKLTPDEGRAYLARWEMVRLAEEAELRRTPEETKLHQLAALVAGRNLFNADPDREAELQVVRERWARLRQALGG